MNTSTPGAASELLPCPFCGSPAERTQRDNEHSIIYKVECTQCYARVIDDEAARNADAAWNRRTPATVTEGAQRDAVAFPREPTTAMLILLNSSIDGAQKWKCLVEAQDSLPKAPPPPDRVQPERVEEKKS